MVNYQLGKIYKLVDNSNGKNYIGSTCKQYLSNRLAGHRTDYQIYLKGNFHFITSFEIIKNGDYDIVLIESYPCDDKMQLHARERYYIETLDCVNKICPTRTKHQYYEANKDKMKQQMKDYSRTHKEEINKFCEENKDKINERRRENEKLKRKEVNEKHKQYYETHKDEINAKRREMAKLKKEQANNI